jgi:hypothetical protein
MTLTQLYALIEANLTRVGANRITGPEIKEVCNQIVNYFAANTDLLPDWTIAGNYNTNGTGSGKYAKHPDTNGRKRLFETKTDSNTGNTPPTDPLVTENTHWIEISQSAAAAIPDWTAGVYGAGLVIVHFNNELYKLNVGPRPFSCTYIITEIAAGQWVKRSQSATGLYIAPNADVTAAPIILDSALYADILFNGSAAISTNKTLQFNNDGNGRRKRFLFTISGTPVLTLPSNCKMQGWQMGWDDATKTLDFGALGAGDYELEFTWKTAGTYFQTKLSGPF